jgi:hypothetical protein
VGGLSAAVLGVRGLRWLAVGEGRGKREEEREIYWEESVYNLGRERVTIRVHFLN